MAWQWVELLHSAFDSSYVPEVYRKPVERAPENTSKEEINKHYKKLRDEANEYAKNIPIRGVEMTLGTVEKIPTMALDGISLALDTLALIDPEPFTKAGLGTAGGIATFSALAAETRDSYLLHNSGNNHAPLQTVFNTYIPPWVPLIGGDPHYYAGGSAIDHPLAHVEPPSNKNPFSHVPFMTELKDIPVVGEKLPDFLKFTSQEDAGYMQAVKRLFGEELDIAKLDLNHDGKLDSQDVKLLREKLGIQWADRLLEELKSQDVVFDGKSKLNVPSVTESTSHSNTSTTVPGARNPDNKPGFWSELWESIVSAFSNMKNSIVAFFSNSSDKTSKTNTTAVEPSRSRAESTVMAVPQGLPLQPGTSAVMHRG